MEWYAAAAWLIGGLLFLVLIGVPVAASLGLISFIFLIVAAGWDRSLVIVSTQFLDFWSNWTLLPIPLFVFMGEFLFAGGQASDIFEVASKWLRRLPGGMSVATTGACAIFGTMTGSSLGATATFAVLAIPEMLRRGYSARLSCGTVTAAGGLAHLIPPSVIAVVYAGLLDLSIGRQFMAGFIPGFILAGAYMVVAGTWVTLKPGSAPKEAPVSWKDRLLSLRKIWSAVIIVLAVLGTIYTGVATVTEAAGMGALAAFLIALASRKLTWAVFRHTILSTLKTSAFIMLIAVAGKLLSWVMTYYLIPQNIVRLMLAAELNRWWFIIFAQILYLILGCFIDGIGMVVITMPIYYPVLLTLGFDPYWFGVLLFINMEVALVTPPLGFNLYIVKGVVPQVSLTDIMLGSFVFNIADLSILGLVMVFPSLALWLPSRMFGG